MSTDKKPTFGFTKRNGFIYLTGVRVRPFCALTSPATNLGGVEQYSVTGMISEEQFKFLEGEMKKAARIQWKDKAEMMYGKLDSKNKGARFFEVEATGESFWGVKATRNAVDRNGNPVKAPLVKQGAGGQTIEPGDYVVLCLTPKAYDYNGVRGIKFDFAAMAFEKKGEPLGGRKYAEDDEFEGIVSEEADVPESW